MDAEADENPPVWIVDALERSEAQIAAGQTVLLEPVMDNLRASIGRMQAGEAKPAPRRTRKA